MPSENERRMECARVYRALPLEERRACRLLAAIYIPADTRVFLSIYRTICRLGGVPQVWRSEDELTKLFGGWHESGGVERYVLQGIEYWRCHELLTELLFRESLRNGEFSAFERIIDEYAQFSSVFDGRGGSVSGRPRFRSRAACYRGLRSALYSGDLSLYRTLEKDARYERDNPVDRILFPANAGRRLASPFLRFLCNPIDPEIFLNLPLEIGVRALTEAYLFFLMDKECIRVLREILHNLYDRFCKRICVTTDLENGDAMRDPSEVLCSLQESSRDADLLCTLMGMDLLMRNRLDDARKLLKKWFGRQPPIPEANAAMAVLALSTANLGGARSFFERGLALSKGYRTANEALDIWMNIVYPILLLEADGHFSGRTFSGGRRQFDRYVEELEPHSLCARILGILGGNREDGERIFGSEIRDALGRASPAEILCFTITASWVDPGRTRPYAAALDHYARQMRDIGQVLLAAEIASIVRKVAPEFLAEWNDLPEPVYSIGNLTKDVPRWQRSLDALTGVVGILPFFVDRSGVCDALPPETANVRRGVSRTRVLWELDWRAAPNERIRNLRISLRKQIMKDGEWSRGRRVSLESAVYDDNLDEALTPSERAALDAVSPDVLGARLHKLLRFLADNDRLVREGNRDSVDLSRADPVLILADAGAEVILRMEPAPDETEMRDGCVVFADAPNVLRVVPFDDLSMEIATVVTEQGLRFPKEVLDLLVRPLFELRSHISVSFEPEEIGHALEEWPPDCRIHVRLIPRPDSLDIAVFVRPFGCGTTVCLPGVGIRCAFGAPVERVFVIRRDLEAEERNFARFIEECPALSLAAKIRRFRWRISEAMALKHFFPQLREMADMIVVEWPQGGMGRERRLSVGDLRLVAADDGLLALAAVVEVDEDLVLSLRELLILLDGASGPFIQVDDGRFLIIEEEMRRKLEAVQALGKIKGEALELPSPTLPVLWELFGKLTSVSREDWFDEKLRAFEEARELSFESPRGLRVTMHPYQREGFQWLARLRHWGTGACLADDMGLGKTVQCLALLLHCVHRGPSLVVAPATVCANWADEAARFAPSLRVRDLRAGDRAFTVRMLGARDLLVISYGLLQSEAELLCSVAWNVVILDEAQNIKNTSTARSKIAKALPTEFRIAATGTPIENRLSELWNLFDFIAPGYLGTRSRFAERFAQPIEAGQDDKARERLKSLVSPFLLRRTKADVLTDLPPKTEIVRRVEMKPDEREVFAALQENALDELAGERSKIKILKHIQKLRRACCHPALVLADADRDYPSAKLESFSELLDELLDGGHRVLIFSQFVGYLKLLRRCLEEKNVRYQYLDGSTCISERARRVADFQSGSGDAFLISLKAGGTGINLTAADYVIHMDPWWNPAVEDQATDRIHRMGQRRAVTVYKIIVKNSIEEKILEMHKKKRALADTLLRNADHPTGFLSVEELLDMIR